MLVFAGFVIWNTICLDWNPSHGDINFQCKTNINNFSFCQMGQPLTATPGIIQLATQIKECWMKPTILLALLVFAFILFIDIK